MKTDLQIKQDVTDKLRWEPSVNAAQIGVEVSHGIVTLAGQVDFYVGPGLPVCAIGGPAAAWQGFELKNPKTRNVQTGSVSILGEITE